MNLILRFIAHENQTIGTYRHSPWFSEYFVVSKRSDKGTIVIKDLNSVVPGVSNINLIGGAKSDSVGGTHSSKA